ncbi:STAS domain-containing protein [Nocardioides sp. dk4132]|uniref:STAS domain-containing protein n=1 Tax=unclassified Nocardioides TaxID=2615069 RepID=UPI0012953DCD|nr:MULTISPECIES: STAS domain-containing protein [unclassified Nocardioides]MQW75510.1 STAS domain-containing protein [Nocardioides sp. dk4132]QGA08425.1 STAS domain-containing protein [Nocardioides sp. dk884]
MEIHSDGPALVLSGDFDVRSTSVVRQALYAHLDARGEGEVVVDLTDVHVVDLTALKVLALASRRAHEDHGQQLVLRGCGPAVRRMLHKSRLIRVLEVERTAIPA